LRRKKTIMIAPTIMAIMTITRRSFFFEISKSIVGTCSFQRYRLFEETIKVFARASGFAQDSKFLSSPAYSIARGLINQLLNRIWSISPLL
jgi:hypothetical protein